MLLRVFLADDHAVLRDGLRFLLEAQSDIKVIGEASDGKGTVCQVQRLHPDVVIMDLVMPELNGVDATSQIRQHDSPAAQVIILSMHSTIEHVFRALNAGARGYVLKESAGKELVDAVRAVHLGRLYLSPQITEIMLETYGAERSASRSPLRSLSSRERQVLQMVMEGKPSARIAEILHLSPKTVETYRSRLMHKLGIHDLPGLVKFAIQHGLTPLK